MKIYIVTIYDGQDFIDCVFMKGR